MGKQGKVGGGKTRKKRKVLDKIVGRGLATAAEWAVANVPSQQGQPRHPPALWITFVSTRRGSVGTQEKTVVLAALPLLTEL